MTTWTGRGVVFPNTKTKSKGIHKTIQNVFAPSFHFERLLDKPKNVGGLSFKAAKKKGKQIDRELNNNHSSTKKCSEVKSLLAELQKREFEIVGTQVTVSDESTRLATLIDMIVIQTKTNRKFIVEIKYSCLYRYCSTFQGSLKFQDSFLNDCLFHQHQLQALIGRWLYQQTFPKESDLGALLIYINTDSTIEIFDEDYFAVRMTSNTIQALRDNASLTNKQLKRKATCIKRDFFKKTKKNNLIS